MEYFNFAGLVNVGFAGAVTIIIQGIKNIVDRNRKLDGSFWLIVVLLSGIPSALIMSIVDGWVGSSIIQIVVNFIIKSFLYSACSSLLYQTGKISIGALFEKKD